MVLTLSRDDFIRPVELELIELFNQNTEICVTISEATEILREHGYPHSDKAVRDNLFILTSAGFLTYDKDGCSFSLSSNTTKTKPCELPQPKHKHPEHCDKCGRKFSRGDVFFPHPFANIELYLCSECHAPKVVAYYLF
jgi:Fe2+ or Zn2+ uptake regulation protein